MRAEPKPSALGLRGIKLLEGVSMERLQALAETCAWRSYDAGQQIISRHATDRDVYLVVAGKVRINMFSATGREVTLRDLHAGDMFGDFAAVDEGDRSADAMALESVVLASLHPAAFRDLLQQEPAVAERFNRRLVELVRLLNERVIELSTWAVNNRIHAELLRLACEAGVHHNRSRIQPAPRHADIASQVSTTREQVTRELSSMAAAGMLSRDGGALVVMDVSGLEAKVRLLDPGAGMRPPSKPQITSPPSSGV